MQIVIEIPEEDYIRLRDEGMFGNVTTFKRAVREGTPLPKGHGRLIILSEDAVKREQTPLGFSCQNWISDVGLSNATVAIIEADECTYEETGCGSCKRQLDCPIEADRAESEDKE